jgi:hypothetical protein
MPFIGVMGDDAERFIAERDSALKAMRAEFEEREEAMRVREADVLAMTRWARRLVAYAFGFPVLFEFVIHLPWLLRHA